jgi:hypothetical protein
MASIFGAVTSESPPKRVIASTACYEIRCFDRRLAAEVVCKDTEKGFNALARYVAESAVDLRIASSAASSKTAAAPALANAVATVVPAPSPAASPSAPPAPAPASPRPSPQSPPPRMEMTAPLHSERMPGGSTSTRALVYMPNAFNAPANRERLPAPRSADVRIVELPPACYAVASFEGAANGTRFGDREESREEVCEAALRAALERDGVRVAAANPEPKLWRWNPPWTLPWLRRNEIAFEIENAHTVATRLASEQAAAEQPPSLTPSSSEPSIQQQQRQNGHGQPPSPTFTSVVKATAKAAGTALPEACTIC